MTIKNLIFVALLLSATQVSLFAQSGTLASNQTMPKKTYPKLNIGDAAPEMAFTDLEGKTYTSKDFSGKVLVVSFLASWCAPCRLQTPEVLALSKKFKRKNVLFLFVSTDSNPDSWKTMVAETFKGNKSRKVIHVNSADVLPVNYMISGIPNYFIIGRDGKIAFNSRDKSAIKAEDLIHGLLKK